MVEKKSTTKVEKKVETKKEDSKITELKIELLKQGSKKRDIKREIARLLTLQNKIWETKNNHGHMPEMRFTDSSMCV